MTKRSHGDGGIDQRGENRFRLRYRTGKRRFAKTFHGTLSDAKKELRALLRSGDTGEHVAPDKATLSGWAEQWIEAGAPGSAKTQGRWSCARALRAASANARAASTRRTQTSGTAVNRD